MWDYPFNGTYGTYVQRGVQLVHSLRTARPHILT